MDDEVSPVFQAQASKPLLALTVKQALYDPVNEQLIATFENLGNAGIYEITSVTVKDKDDETIGTASDEEVVYIAAGELLPVTFDINFLFDINVTRYHL